MKWMESFTSNTKDFNQALCNLFQVGLFIPKYWKWNVTKGNKLWWISLPSKLSDFQQAFTPHHFAIIHHHQQNDASQPLLYTQGRYLKARLGVQAVPLSPIWPADASGGKQTSRGIALSLRKAFEWQK